MIPKPKCTKVYIVKKKKKKRMSLLCLKPWNLVPPSWEAIISSLFIFPEVFYYHFLLLSHFSPWGRYWKLFILFLPRFPLFLSGLFLQTTRLTFPGDLLQNVNFLLMDFGFILFPTPVSALVRSLFVCDSWWSQAPSDEWWMGPGGTTLP